MRALRVRVPYIPELWHLGIETPSSLRGVPPDSRDPQQDQKPRV